MHVSGLRSDLDSHRYVDENHTEGLSSPYYCFIGSPDTILQQARLQLVVKLPDMEVWRAVLEAAAVRLGQFNSAFGAAVTWSATLCSMLSLFSNQFLLWQTLNSA